MLWGVLDSEDVVLVLDEEDSVAEGVLFIFDGGLAAGLVAVADC